MTVAGVQCGRRLFGRFGPAGLGERGADQRLRKAEEAAMSGLTILAGLLALGLLIYLVIALFFPERFS